MTIIHHYLRKELLFLLSSLLTLFFLTSCQKQPDLGQFGGAYVSDNSSANVVVIDSSTIAMSTIFVDSTATAGTGFMLVGNYNDTYLGQVTSQSYIQVRPPPTLPTINPQLDTYDSIGMVLYFKKGNPYYGDTAIAQTYVVNQVDTLFELPQFKSGWYSNVSLPLGPDLGSVTVAIAPSAPYTSQNAGDTVKIRMDDNLGQQLYSMIYNKSDSVQTLTTFLNWFHGLCVSPAPGSQGVMFGFKDSALMRIYYRENGSVSTTKTIDFTIYNRASQFNHITNNRAGSPIANLVTPTSPIQPPPLTPSSATHNASYVQTIGGLNVKLTFPFLNAIAQRPDYIGLLRAQLTVIPLAGSFSTTWTIPPQVGIFYTDLHNLQGAPLFSAASASPQTGNLSLNYFYPLQTSYTYDITNFVKTQISNTSPYGNQTGLMLSVPSPAGSTSFSRLVLGDQSYPADQRIILSVYYISLFPHQ
jgi:hypothetical protein